MSRTRQPPPGRRYDPRDPRSRPRGGAEPGRPPVTEDDRQAAAGRGPTGPSTSRPSAGPGAGPERLHLALIPLRLFLGATFLYAGLDKLLDRAFLHASGPGSIGQQLEGFTHVSPVAPLVGIFALPFPVLTGLLIALLEIAIGIGALTGLLHRLSAAGGFALSILFWLTASWATKPYYYGPDLPYAFGWLTLALAGHGGLYTIESWLDRWAGVPAGFPSGQGAAETSSERRVFLQAAAIGAVAVAIGGVTGVIGRVLRPGDDGGPAVAAANLSPGVGSGTLPETVGSAPGAVSPTGTSTAPTAPAASATVAPTTSSPDGPVIATLDQVKPRHALAFQDPTTGDPAILVRLASDHVVAYDALCTHEGCTVGYDSASGLLLCPCHGAVFDPAHAGEVLGGPTNQPLTSLPLRIDAATGRISLQG